MEVRVAKTAGFCFGVKRAVDQVYRQAREGQKPIYTFGPIIHNELVVEDLRRKGVEVLHSPEELLRISRGTVIIRSHGVGKDICDQITAQGLSLVDATCPYVKKIHRIVRERSRDGWEIVIVGDPAHAEVQGICGWANGPVTVIETEEQAVSFAAAAKTRQSAARGSGKKVPLCVVSQTTFNYKKFNKIIEILVEIEYYHTVIINTICNATEERQTEARELAASADAMIIIGGRHSSNTQKLYEICKGECENTYFIESLDDLDFRLLPSVGCVGITAGASTPNHLIEEVSKHVGIKF